MLGFCIGIVVCIHWILINLVAKFVFLIGIFVPMQWIDMNLLVLQDLFDSKLHC